MNELYRDCFDFSSKNGQSILCKITQVGEISKRSSEKWKSLSQEERAVWDAKAEEDKERYNREKDKYTGPWQVPWKRAKKVSHESLPLQ